MDVNLLTPHLSAFAFPTECFEKIRKISYEKLEYEERDAAVEWLVNNENGYCANPHMGIFFEDFFAALQILFEKPGCFGISELRLLHCYSMSKNIVSNFYHDKLETHCELRDERKKALSSQVIKLLKEKVIDHIRSATQVTWLVRNLAQLVLDSVTECDTLRKIFDRYVAFYDELAAEEKYDSLAEIIDFAEWFHKDSGDKNDELIHTLTRDLVKMSTLEFNEEQKKIIGKICLYLSSYREISAEACSYSPSLHDHTFLIALKIVFFESDIAIITSVMQLVNSFSMGDFLENRIDSAWKILSDPRLPDIMHKGDKSYMTFIAYNFHQPEMLSPLLDLGWSPVFIFAITEWSGLNSSHWPQFEQPQFISTARRIQLRPQESGGKYAPMEESPEWEKQCRRQDERKPSRLFALIDEDDF